jgi:hypothetical protein
MLPFSTQHSISLLILLFLRTLTLISCLPADSNGLEVTSRAAAASVVPHVSSTVVTLGSGAYPRILHLSDGSILASFTHVQSGNNILTVTRSTDGGNTFSSWGTVATMPSNTTDLDNAFLIQLSSGTVLCFFRNHDRKTGGGYSFYRITSSQSTDGGQTWTFLSQVAQRAANADSSNGLWVSPPCT